MTETTSEHSTSDKYFFFFLLFVIKQTRSMNKLQALQNQPQHYWIRMVFKLDGHQQGMNKMRQIKATQTNVGWEPTCQQSINIQIITTSIYKSCITISIRDV